MTQLLSTNYKTTFLSNVTIAGDYDRSEIWNSDKYVEPGQREIVSKIAQDRQSSAFDHLFWNYPSGTLHAWVWECVINCHRMLNTDQRGYINLEQISHYPGCMKYFCEEFGDWKYLPSYRLPKTGENGYVIGTQLLSPHNYLRILLKKASETVTKSLDIESLNHAVLQQIEKLANIALKDVGNRDECIKRDWRSILEYKMKWLCIFRNHCIAETVEIKV